MEHLLPPGAKVVQWARSPELPANLGLGDVSIAQRHSQRLVTEYLPHELEVSSLLQNRGRGVVAKGMRTHDLWQLSPPAQAVQNVSTVIARE